MKKWAMTLFKAKPEEDRRSTSTLLRWTHAELQTVKRSAEVRCLPTSEFIRRAALGRKADVRYEDKVILELREVAQAIRDFHTLYVAHNMEPPEEIKELFRISIRQAVEAMLRISK